MNKAKSTNQPRTDRLKTQHLLSPSPALTANRPGRLRNKRGEREPVEILVLLQICERDEQEPVERGGVVRRHRCGPDLALIVSEDDDGR